MEIKTKIDQSSAKNDMEGIKVLLGNFETAIWPRLTDLSSRIFFNKRHNEIELSDETTIQQELKQTGARLRFKAGYGQPF